MALAITTLPAHAQFPETLEDQQRYLKEKQQEIERQKKKYQDKRGADDPRKVVDPRETKDQRGKTILPSPKDPRDVSPSSAYPAKPKLPSRKRVIPVCDQSKPKDCSEALAEAYRLCSGKASGCKLVPSRTEDQSCAAMRCDIDKALCMKAALNQYILCMDKELQAAAARDRYE